MMAAQANDNAPIGLTRRIIDQVPIGVFVVDAQRRICHWNHWLEQKTGIPRESALDQTLEQLFPGLRKPRFHAALEAVLRHGASQILSQALNHFLIPIPIPHTGRHGIPMMRQHVHIAPLRDQTGQSFAVVSLIDVTDEVIRSSRLTELTQKLEHESNRDPLTNLYNRRFMWEWLVQQLRQSSRFDYPLACIMLDLDHFKRVNDRLGHAVGDQVLVSFTQVVRGRLRDSDILVRYGGEEFVALLPHCPLDLAMRSAWRIVRGVAQQALAPLGMGEMTCSAGVATYTKDSPLTGEELLKLADRRLYEAKNTGRNRVAGGNKDIAAVEWA